MNLSGEKFFLGSNLKDEGHVKAIGGVQRSRFAGRRVKIAACALARYLIGIPIIFSKQQSVIQPF